MACSQWQITEPVSAFSGVLSSEGQTTLRVSTSRRFMRIYVSNATESTLETCARLYCSKRGTCAHEASTGDAEFGPLILTFEA